MRFASNVIVRMTLALCVAPVVIHARAPDQVPCQLGIAESPALRGLRLGMTAEQALAALDTDAAREKVRLALRGAEAPGRFDHATMSLQPQEHGGPDVKRVYVALYRGRVVQVHVEYPSEVKGGVRWRDVDELVERVSEALKLPGPEAWGAGKHSDRALECNGFRVEVRLSPPSVTLLDPSFVAEIEERQRAADAERRRSFQP